MAPQSCLLPSQCLNVVFDLGEGWLCEYASFTHHSIFYAVALSRSLTACAMVGTSAIAPTPC
jgi:hypothetical protein